MSVNHLKNLTELCFRWKSCIDQHGISELSSLVFLDAYHYDKIVSVNHLKSWKNKNVIGIVEYTNLVFMV